MYQASGRGERLGLVVNRQRGEAAPQRVAAQQLHCTGEKHQAKQQPAEKPDHNRRRTEKYCQKPRFEQQCVPLIRHEHLAGTCDRQIQYEKRNPDNPPLHADYKKGRETNPRDPDGLEESVARAQPQDCRNIPIRRCSQIVSDGGQEFSYRQNPVRTH